MSRAAGRGGRPPGTQEPSSPGRCRIVSFYTPGVGRSIHTCQPVRFPVMGLRLHFLTAPPPRGAGGEGAGVFTTRNTGGAGPGAGRRGAGRSALLLPRRFLEAARPTLAGSRPAARRPGGSLWSQPCLAKGARPTLAAGPAQKEAQACGGTLPAVLPLVSRQPPNNAGAEAGSVRDPKAWRLH